MGRSHRVDSTGGWFHVVNRGAAKQTIFHGDRDRVEFGRLIGVAHERHGVVVHAYCLMTNHYHLVVECPDGQLSEAMHAVASTFVRHVNDRVGRDGPLFRDRFYAKPVRSDEYLVRLVRYVHRNPLAMLPMSQLVDYRWSSLRTLLGYRRAPVWMRCDTVLEMCGGVDGVRRLVLGGSEHDGSAASAASDIAAATELFVDERLGERARQGAARTVAVLLLDRVEPRHVGLVRRELAFPSAGAERTARSRARARAADHPELLWIADAAADFLGLQPGVTGCAWHNL